MTNGISDENVVKAATLQVRIEHAKVLQRILEMFGIPTSTPVHSATAS
jgi:hypothetical protein